MSSFKSIYVLNLNRRSIHPRVAVRRQYGSRQSLVIYDECSRIIIKEDAGGWVPVSAASSGWLLEDGGGS